MLAHIVHLLPMMRHVPNILTSIRILLAFFFPFSAVNHRVPIVVLALLTEYFDGAICRWFAAASRLGQLLDPIADKLFFLAVAVTFIREGDISVGEFAFLAVRDICVFTAVVWTLAHGRYPLMRKMEPVFIGKVVTASQYVVSLDVLLAGSLNRALFYAASAVSLIAAVRYWVAFRRMWRSAEA